MPKQHRKGKKKMTWYALANYRRDHAERAALVLGTQLFDLAQTANVVFDGAAPDWSRQPVDALVANWSDIAPDLQRFAAKAAIRQGELRPLTIGASDILPPVRPQRVFCAASNFVEHANEMGTVLAAKVDSQPYVFLKPNTSVIGQNDVVRLPAASKQVDWEVELGAVIGQTTRNISVERALDCVAGYTVVNDVSARDLNMRTDFPFKFDWFRGKCFDTFAPIGPWIVPAHLIADPQDVHMRLTVNDEVMQNGSTAEMIFNVREQIAYLSSILTLQPGDVIATGTPTGVGMGRGIFLKPGDVMEAYITGIGTLRNPVAAE
jgi:2,4-diketo-3-deoxy-L-fuconate hydrolase